MYYMCIFLLGNRKYVPCSTVSITEDGHGGGRAPTLSYSSIIIIKENVI